MRETSSKRKLSLCLGLVTFLALLVRLWGINFGLPYGAYFRPDETKIVYSALAFGYGDLNPHWFMYPSLAMYLNFFLYGGYYFLLSLFGIVGSVKEFAAFYYLNSGPFYLIARLISVLAGTGSVIVLYAIGRKTYSHRTGLLAALFLAFCFLHARDSHFIKLDVLMTFFLLLSFFFLVRVTSSPKIKDYLLAGCFAGLAISTRYNAGMVLIPMLVTHLLVTKTRLSKLKNRPWWSLVLMLLAVVFFFLVGTPFALLDFSTFREDFMAIKSSATYPWFPEVDLGSGWWYHLSFSLRHSLGMPLLILALTGLGWSLISPTKTDLVFLSFALPYYSYVGSWKILQMRYLIPLLPLFCLWAAKSFEGVIKSFFSLKLPKFLKWGMSAFLVGLVIFPSGKRLVQHNLLISRKDTRILAKEWIESQIPSGTSLALAGYWYDFPPLWESRDSLKRRLEGKKTGGRYAFYLTDDRYLNLPQYSLFRLSEEKAESIDSYPFLRLGEENFKKENIKYLVTHEYSPLHISFKVEENLVLFLKNYGDLVKEISPFRPGTKISPSAFAQHDPYYVPVAKFEGVERPGPLIKIYRLKK